MSSSYYMCVPSHTKKGPLRAKDVEHARMPCYIASDHHYFHNGTYHVPPTLLHDYRRKLTPMSCTVNPTTTTCTICSEDTLSPETIFRQLPCKHAFHKPCIDKWICTKDASCPLCRQTFYHLRKPFMVSGSGDVVEDKMVEDGDGDGDEDKDEDERWASWEEFTSWWRKFFHLV